MYVCKYCIEQLAVNEKVKIKMNGFVDSLSRVIDLINETRHH